MSTLEVGRGGRSISTSSISTNGVMRAGLVEIETRTVGGGVGVLGLLDAALTEIQPGFVDNTQEISAAFSSRLVFVCSLSPIFGFLASYTSSIFVFPLPLNPSLSLASVVPHCNPHR